MMNRCMALPVKKLQTYLEIAWILILFLLVFGHTHVKLARDWSSNPNYSHGYLIPVIAGYMVWTKRRDLARICTSPSNWGFLIVALGLVLHVLGNMGAELFTMRVAMIITLAGLVICYAGNSVAAALAFPLGFLLFMVPVPAIIWNAVSFPLQLFASKMAAAVVWTAGIPVLREGNVLHLASVDLEVLDACSGLRSLVSLLAFSAAFAYLSVLRGFWRWVLCLSEFPIAIAVNGLRLIVTALLAHLVGIGIAEGFLHELSGMFTFFVGLVLVYFVYALLVRYHRKG